MSFSFNNNKGETPFSSFINTNNTYNKWPTEKTQSFSKFMNMFVNSEESEKTSDLAKHTSSLQNSELPVSKPPRTQPKPGDSRITHEVTETLFIGDLIPNKFPKPAVFIGFLYRTFPGIQIKQCLVFNKPTSAYSIITFDGKDASKRVKESLQGQFIPEISVKGITTNYRIALEKEKEVKSVSTDDTSNSQLCFHV